MGSVADPHAFGVPAAVIGIWNAAVFEPAARAGRRRGFVVSGAVVVAVGDGAADQAADDAAMAADNAASGAGKAAENAAEDAGAAADEAEMAADAVTEAVPQVTPPDVNPPAISEAEPGVLSSWVTSRNIWTTNQPSSTVWVDPTLEKRPGEWQNIAKVNDIVLDDSGEHVVGYVADIGGFLGIGAKKVLLGEDAIHLVTVGNDTFFATNYTKQELQALPDFDEKTVRK